MDEVRNVLAPTGWLLILGFGYTIRGCSLWLYKVTLSGLKLRVVRAYNAWPESGMVGLVTIRIGWLQGLCFILLNKNVAVKVINARDYIGLKVVQLALVRMVTRRIADGFIKELETLVFFLSFQCWNFRTVDGG
jgi:hypothetical protein